MADKSITRIEPTAGKPPDELALLREEVARLTKLVEAQQAAPAQQAAVPLTAPLAAYESWEQKAAAVREEARQKYIAWACLTSQEKTQLAADKQWGKEDLPRFVVSIPKDPVQPRVKIPAHSPEEARGRFQLLCGILRSDHPIEAVPAA